MRPNVQLEQTCRRCLQGLENGIIETIDLLEIGLQTVFLKLTCANCQMCVALRLHEEWQPIEAYLNNLSQQNNGWQVATTEEDKFIVYIMSQIMNNENDSETERFLDFPDQGDIIKIYWQNGQALGFYSLKLKGASSTYFHLLTYGMHIMDTAFIIPRCRRQGLGKTIVRDMMEMFPGENIGFSSPLSRSMRHVLQKVMDEEPSYQMKIWEVRGVGSQGDRKLVYYSNRNTIN